MNLDSKEYKQFVYNKICEDIENSKHTHYENTFKIQFPLLYENLKHTIFKFDISNFPFTAKLLLFLKDDFDCLMCKCPICGNELSCKYIDFKHGFHKTCSIECKEKLKKIKYVPKSKEKRNETLNNRLQKYKQKLLEKYKFDTSQINDKNYVYNFLMNFQNTGMCFFREPVFKNQFPILYNEYTSFLETCCDEIKKCNLFTRKLFHFFHNEKDLSNFKCVVCGENVSFRDFKNGYNKTCSVKCAISTDLYWEKYWSSFNKMSDDDRKKIYTERGKKIHKKWLKKTKEEIKERNVKIWKTKKNNNTTNTSQIENDIIEWFTKNNIQFYHNYICDLYPFHCDFYLPDYKLFIEIQGHWTHNTHPFNKNDKDDMMILQEMIRKSKNSMYYKNAIKVWTDSDVKKRNIAEKNSLNYLEIFSINKKEVIENIKSKITINEL